MRTLEDRTKQATLPPAREEEFDLKDIFMVLRRRLGIIIGTMVFFTSFAWMLSINLTPEYTANSTIVVEPSDTSLINFNDARRSIAQNEPMINTQVKVLTSTFFVRQVIEKLDLLSRPEYNVNLRGRNKRDLFEAFISDKASTVISKALSWVSIPLVEIGLANQPPPSGPNDPNAQRVERRGQRIAEKADEHVPARLGEGGRSTELARLRAMVQGGDLSAASLVARSAEFDSNHSFGTEQGRLAGSAASGWDSLGAGLSQEQESRSSAVAGDSAHDALMAAATKLFLDRLDVGPAGQSYAITVAFTSVDPETAAQVPNIIGELYVENQLKSKQIATSGTLDWLTGRLNELRAQLVEADKAAETYREQNQLFASGRGLQFDDQEGAALSQELIRARAERLEIEAKLQRIQELRSSGQSLESVPEIMLSPVIANLRQMEMGILREESQLRQDYGPHHPSMIQIEADKDKIHARIDGEIQHVIGGLVNQIATIHVREETLQARLEEAKSGSLEKSHAEIQLRLLERDVESTRTLYATYLDKFKELTEQRQILEPGARVISNAAVPTIPSFPRVELMTGAGFMGSLMFGILLAFVVDRVDGGLRTGRQTEGALNVPNIGFVPKVGRAVRGRGPHLYIVKKPTSAYAEAIRAVQTALYFSNVDRPPQVVLVTSSLPAEGKTTLALSLAALLAASGHTTVAVDLDLRAPALRRYLRKRGGCDLIDYMKGQTELDQILHEVDEVENLHVIPARRLVGSPTDLLVSQRMASLMAELRVRYRYVILDSPPILGMSDSRFAAVLADAVVFVARWNKTGEETAQKALTVLRESGTPVAGAVLAQVNIRRHRNYSAADVAHYDKRYKRYYVN